jgi:hypothetical protein
MTTRRAHAALAFLLQLMPLALIAAYLFMLSKPLDNPSGMPGVAFYTPLGMWYVFPYSILLGLAGIAAIVSRRAAVAATIVTAGAVAYGLRLLLPGDDPGLGTWLIVLSGLSIVGGIWRVSGRSHRVSRV